MEVAADVDARLNDPSIIAALVPAFSSVSTQISERHVRLTGTLHPGYAADRVREHREAGATHVCIQPLDVDDPARPSVNTLERLAPLLLGN